MMTVDVLSNSSKAITSQTLDPKLFADNSKQSVAVETITPDAARSILAANSEASNRRVIHNHVEFLAAQIREGRWLLNGESIKFSDEGILIDGQHRLRAVVAAGRPIQSLVVRRIAAGAFTTIDTGKKRGGNDVLSIAGYQNVNVLAAALVWLFRYERRAMESSGNVGRPSNAQMLELVAAHSGIVASVSLINNEAFRSIWTPGQASFCHYLFSRLSPSHADSYFDGIETGVNLGSESPVRIFRERLIQNKAAKAKLPPVEIMALAFKAWNAHRSGMPMRSLRWRTSGPRAEEFPEIE